MLKQSIAALALGTALLTAGQAMAADYVIDKDGKISKGGTELGAMLEGFAQSPIGKQVIDKFTTPKTPTNVTE